MCIESRSVFHLVPSRLAGRIWVLVSSSGKGYRPSCYFVHSSAALVEKLEPCSLLFRPAFAFQTYQSLLYCLVSLILNVLFPFQDKAENHCNYSRVRKGSSAETKFTPRLDMHRLLKIAFSLNGNRPDLFKTDKRNGRITGTLNLAFDLLLHNTSLTGSIRAQSEITKTKDVHNSSVRRASRRRRSIQEGQSKTRIEASGLLSRVLKLTVLSY
jgi:hypothetical protein